MKKFLLLILLIMPFSIIFSCGESRHSGLNSSKQDNQPIAYYIVTDVITPDNHTLSYSSEINDIYSQNNNYNLVMAEFSGSFQVSISCLSQDCIFLSKENLTAIEGDSFAKLLNKLNYPDKITNVADENGYRYNAFKLSDQSDINKFKKIIYRKS
jgi:hypothetical protein